VVGVLRKGGMKSAWNDYLHLCTISGTGWAGGLKASLGEGRKEGGVEGHRCNCVSTREFDIDNRMRLQILHRLHEADGHLSLLSGLGFRFAASPRHFLDFWPSKLSPGGLKNRAPR